MVDFDFNGEIAGVGELMQEIGERLTRPDELTTADLVEVHAILHKAANTLGLVVSVSLLLDQD